MRKIAALLFLTLFFSCDPVKEVVVPCPEKDEYKFIMTPKCIIDFEIDMNDPVVAAVQKAMELEFNNLSVPICEKTTGFVGDFLLGAIVIRHDDSLPTGVGAVTKVKYSDQEGTFILAATIRFNPTYPCNLEKVAWHEVKHALGWCRHSSDPNDIMYPYCSDWNDGLPNINP